MSMKCVVKRVLCDADACKQIPANYKQGAIVCQCINHTGLPLVSQTPIIIELEAQEVSMIKPWGIFITMKCKKNDLPQKTGTTTGGQIMPTYTGLK